jgi:hypothetical protein
LNSSDELAIISPDKILPFPQFSPRKGRQDSRKMTSEILTSSPVIERLKEKRQRSALAKEKKETTEKKRKEKAEGGEKSERFKIDVCSAKETCF